MQTERARMAAAIVFGGLLLVGCPGQVYYTALLAPPHPLTPRRPEDVAVFVVTPPSRPHTNVGLYQVTEGVDAYTSAAMIERLRRNAGARGCEAILITSIENQSTKQSSPNVQAACVVFNEPQPPSAPGPSAALPTAAPAAPWPSPALPTPAASAPASPGPTERP